MPAHKQHHCLGPDIAAPCPTEMPPRSAPLATPPSDAWLPRTTTAFVDHGSRQETQTGTRRSGSAPHRAIAAIACAWLRKNVRHVCDGGPRGLVMYLETVDSATSKPSLRSSPWMRGAPHNGFSLLICRMRSRNSRFTPGLPGWPHDFQRQYARNPERCPAEWYRAEPRGPIRSSLATVVSAIPTPPGRYHVAADGAVHAAGQY
jgi:hypothetical protein